MMIVETTDNRFFHVTEEPAEIPQCWIGLELVRAKGGVHGFKVKGGLAKSRPQLVRKAGCRIVQEA